MDLPPIKACRHDLPANEFGTPKGLLGALGHGNQPIAVMLTCWELGGAPDELSSAKPGELMVVQNLGGLVPASNETCDDSSLASIVYALSLHDVQHLIVCGHSECKALGMLFNEETVGRKHPFHMLKHSVKDRIESVYTDRPLRELLGILVQETILQQLSNLRSHQRIASRLQQGKLMLHGWIRDDANSMITAYDPVTGQFDS